MRKSAFFYCIRIDGVSVENWFYLLTLVTNIKTTSGWLWCSPYKKPNRKKGYRLFCFFTLIRFFLVSLCFYLSTEYFYFQFDSVFFFFSFYQCFRSIQVDLDMVFNGINHNQTWYKKENRCIPFLEYFFLVSIISVGYFSNNNRDSENLFLSICVVLGMIVWW